MANQAKLTIRVTSSRGASRVSYSTTGRYVSLQTNGLSAELPRQAIMPTTSESAFWLAVLDIVLAQLGGA